MKISRHSIVRPTPLHLNCMAFSFSTSSFTRQLAVYYSGTSIETSSSASVFDSILYSRINTFGNLTHFIHYYLVDYDYFKLIYLGYTHCKSGSIIKMAPSVLSRFGGGPAFLEKATMCGLRDYRIKRRQFISETPTIGSIALGCTDDQRTPQLGRIFLLKQKRWSGKYVKWPPKSGLISCRL